MKAAVCLALALAIPSVANGQTPDGADLFKRTCAQCHEAGDGRAPSDGGNGGGLRIPRWVEAAVVLGIFLLALAGVPPAAFASARAEMLAYHRFEVALAGTAALGAAFLMYLIS